MHWACTGQRLDVVEWLLNKKAKTDLRDCVGRTALHIAFCFESRAIIQVLLDNQADMSKKDNMGRKPNEAICNKNL
jgi:ankyrin repeat protein